jgi:anti-sigma factor RsiW
MSGRPITEEDLHAYVDEALHPARRSEVRDYLDRHPGVERRVSLMAGQRAALRSALASFAEEPVPPELNLARLVEASRRRRHIPWRALAASILLLALGGTGGWLARGPYEPPAGIAALAQEAAASYQVHASDHFRPVEIKAADSGELVRWVSERLQRPVVVPDLSKSGYRFMGGRLVATSHGPAALFLYDDDRGTRLGMLVRPMATEGNAPMSALAQGAVAGFAWANQGLGYSLVAEASADTLHLLANEVRRQSSGGI